MWFPESSIDVEGGMPEAKRVVHQFLHCTIALHDAIKEGTVVSVAAGVDVPEAILDLQERCDDIFSHFEEMSAKESNDDILDIGAEFCDDIPAMLADMDEESQHPGEGLLMAAHELVEYVSNVYAKFV